VVAVVAGFGMAATDTTEPVTDRAAPSGVTAAVWPTFTLVTSARLTFVVASTPPVPRMRIVWVVDAAWALSPGAMLTARTVPAMGLTTLAWSSACWATVTAAVAASTALW
jgi:hypothetical protein